MSRWLVREKKIINWEKILFIIAGIIIQVVGIIAAWQAVSDMSDLKTTYNSLYDLMNSKSIIDFYPTNESSCDDGYSLVPSQAYIPRFIEGKYVYSHNYLNVVQYQEQNQTMYCDGQTNYSNQYCYTIESVNSQQGLILNQWRGQYLCMKKDPSLSLIKILQIAKNSVFVNDSADLFQSNFNECDSEKEKSCYFNGGASVFCQNINRSCPITKISIVNITKSSSGGRLLQTQSNNTSNQQTSNSTSTQQQQSTNTTQQQKTQNSTNSASSNTGSSSNTTQTATLNQNNTLLDSSTYTIDYSQYNQIKSSKLYLDWVQSYKSKDEIYKLYKINENYQYIVSSYLGSGLPLTDLIISRNQPCLTSVTNGSVGNLAFRKKYIPWLADQGEECLTSNDAYGLVESIDEISFFKIYYSIPDSITGIFTLLNKLAQNDQYKYQQMYGLFSLLGGVFKFNLGPCQTIVKNQGILTFQKSINSKLISAYNLINNQYDLQIAIISLVILGVVVQIFFAILNTLLACGYNLECSCFSGASRKEDEQIIERRLRYSDTVINMVIVIIVSVAISKINDVVSIINSITTATSTFKFCFQSYFITNMEDLDTNFSSYNQSSNVIVLIVALSAFIGPFVYTVIRTSFKVKRGWRQQSTSRISDKTKNLSQDNNNTQQNHQKEKLEQQPNSNINLNSEQDQMMNQQYFQQRGFDNNDIEVQNISYK